MTNNPQQEEWIGLALPVALTAPTLSLFAWLLIILFVWAAYKLAVSKSNVDTGGGGD